MSIELFNHPDGEGQICFSDGCLVASHDVEETETRVLIGPAGLRTLARKLSILADLLEVEYKQ